MKPLYKIGADIVWLMHFFVVVVALFGWLVPSIWSMYMATLAGTFLSTSTLGYCILSKWEYALRKKADPHLAYDFSYTSYYTYRLTKGHLSSRFLAHTGLVFVSLSLMINLYFWYW